jgi:hypothetical protein
MGFELRNKRLCWGSMEFIKIPWCLLSFHEECEINKLSGAFSAARMRAEASIAEPAIAWADTRS